MDWLVLKEALRAGIQRRTRASVYIRHIAVLIPSGLGSIRKSKNVTSHTHTRQGNQVCEAVEGTSEV